MNHHLIYFNLGFVTGCLTDSVNRDMTLYLRCQSTFELEEDVTTNQQDHRWNTFRSSGIIYPHHAHHK